MRNREFLGNLFFEADFTRNCIFFRAYQFAGEDGCLTKKNFIKILRSSDLFMKSFDKNKDGVVTEVKYIESWTFLASTIFFFLGKNYIIMPELN